MFSDVDINATYSGLSALDYAYLDLYYSGKL